MQITTVITIFEAALKVYKQAVKEKWTYYKCATNNINRGLCCYSSNTYNIWNLYGLFEKKEGYYKNFINKEGYIASYITINNVIKPLQKRIDFLQEQIPELKKLLKQGYTEV